MVILLNVWFLFTPKQFDMDNLIETKEIGNYRINVFYDVDAICPCVDWDMVACYLWEYSRYDRLSDACDWKEVFGKYGDSRHSLLEALSELAKDYVEWEDLLQYFKDGKLKNYRLRCDDEQVCHLEWYNERKDEFEELLYGHSDTLNSDDVNNIFFINYFADHLNKDELIQIINDLGKDIIVKEWSSTGHCQGDYVEGIAFCTIDRYQKMVDTDTTNWKEKVEVFIDAGAESVGMWMWGDVKGFTLEEKVTYIKKYDNPEREDEKSYEWEEIDSCWGYYMKTDELIEEVINEHELMEVA